ncbi:FtsX-like permease family protein [Sediminibacterium roseum]|uniref:FtsX-like permease family protein n=1 Tax=Sediminibacterium roseum TaxID=1978412 RepID=A0ABW9ZU89_9BACT|nr:ABC transporter permease [Sediminibacterium roseum]NCI50574.1 FtsX-like permease family protein [Sediminibacterium roseum]
MIRNYLKIALRNLLKNKGFSFINVIGLSVGMASAILILLWIKHEIDYDQFHEKKDRIFEAWNKDTFSGELHCWNTTPKIFARTVERDFPEIEQATRVSWPRQYLFSIGEKRLTVQGNFVDSNFLNMFSFPLLKGDPDLVLKDMFNIVLTEKCAKNLFGNEEPMGKTIRINDKDNFTVTGILKDLPNNTRFKFDYILPWAYARKQGDDDESWGNNSTRNYVLLKPNASLASLEPKLRYIKRKYDKDEKTNEMFLYPISRWRLYSRFENGKEDGGLIDFVKMFAVIAAFILLIACINFMNLSTARSEKRAKEVGIRKVVGANKASLIGQFLGESILIAFLAGLVALLIVQLSLPAFGKLTDKILFIDYGNIYFWLLFIGFIIFTGVIAGSYPAFYLSAFKPVKVLKGTFLKSNRVVTPRKVLVVLQFTFAIILIICTTIVKEQIQHARNRDTGYDKENLVFHSLTGDLRKNFPLLKNELLASGVASAVVKTSSPITQGWSDSWGFEWEGKAVDDKTDFDRFCAEDDLGKTIGLQFVQGRDFNLKEFPTDSSGMILNESAVKAMGFKDPIGKIVKDGDKPYHVVGVIKDFILQSPFQPMKPMVIEGANGYFNIIHMKLNNRNATADNLKRAEAIFKKYNPQYPFEYKFVDEDYASKFKSEQRTGTLAALFSGLTIFISCLGLFGLAAYMAESRIKEIGVRKVLGASVTGITTLLSKDFVSLVVIAFVAASPVAWWFMHNWLQSYPYRVTIEWWIFAFAAILSILIALITVSYHAIRAATANPVKSLRTE